MSNIERRDTTKKSETLGDKFQTTGQSIKEGSKNMANRAGEAMKETVLPKEPTKGAPRATETLKDDAKWADRKVSDAVYKGRDETKSIGEKIADKYNKTTESIKESLEPKDINVKEPTLGERAVHVVETLRDDAKWVDRKLSDAVYAARDELTKDSTAGDKEKEIGDKIEQKSELEPTIGEKAYNTAESVLESVGNMAKTADKKISEAVYTTRDEYVNKNNNEGEGIYDSKGELKEEKSIGEKISDTYHSTANTIKNTFQPKEPTLGEKAQKAAENLKEDAKEKINDTENKVEQKAQEWKGEAKEVDRKVTDKTRDELNKDNKTIGDKIADTYHYAADTIKETIRPREPIGEKVQKAADDLNQDAKEMGRKVSDVTEKTKDELTKDNRTISEKIADTYHHAADTVKETLHLKEPTLGEKAEMKAENMKESVKDITKDFDKKPSEEWTIDNRTIGEKIADTYHHAADTVKETLHLKEPTLGEKAEMKAENMKDGVKDVGKKASDAVLKDNRSVSEQIADKYNKPQVHYDRFGIPEKKLTEREKEFEDVSGELLEPQTFVAKVDRKFSEVVTIELQDTCSEPIYSLPATERALKQLERNCELNEL